MNVELISPERSAGIERYCHALECELKSRGARVSIRRRPSSSFALAHFHMGNSARHLLPLAFHHRSRSVVTLHDIVPRNRTIRVIAGLIQPFMLRGHVLVVHSSFAKQLALRSGYKEPIHVVPMGWKASTSWLQETRSTRESLRLCQVGVAKKAKAIPELISAAAKFPSVKLTIAGGISDIASRRALEQAGPNVVELGRCSDETLENEISKSDFVTCFRMDSVGETNAPMVLAHCLGVPVIGWSVGSMPEYMVAGDRLFPRGTPITEVLDRIINGGTAPPLNRLQLRDSVSTYWDESCRQYLNIYSNLGWVVSS